MKDQFPAEQAAIDSARERLVAAKVDEAAKATSCDRAKQLLLEQREVVAELQATVEVNRVKHGARIAARITKGGDYEQGDRTEHEATSAALSAAKLLKEDLEEALKVLEGELKAALLESQAANTQLESAISSWLSRQCASLTGEITNLRKRLLKKCTELSALRHIRPQTISQEGHRAIDPSTVPRTQEDAMSGVWYRDYEHPPILSMVLSEAQIWERIIAAHKNVSATAEAVAA